MNIDKQREAFENLWLAGGGNFDNFIFSEDKGKYAAIENSNLTDKQKEMALYVVNNAYLFFVGGFKQAAKAQAVPEGFVLVTKEPTQAMLDSARDWSTKKYGKAVSPTGASGCYKAMIEAQEPTND